ncbi:MAG: DUF2924 domain-containing protein [Phycisphaeraceae bacterium]
MDLDLKRKIAELRKMSVTQLRRQHIELFGETNPTGHREYLFRRIAWRLQAQAEGDLAERAKRIRARASELARDADVRTTPPPAFRERQGGLDPTCEVRTGTLKIEDDRLPVPGTVLTRTFKGTNYSVTVMPVGFEMDGQIYKSLSAVAKAITGSHWNGYLFFGLTPPKKQNQKGSRAR